MTGEQSAAPPAPNHRTDARRVSGRYARLYAPLTLACAVLVFVPTARDTRTFVVHSAVRPDQHDSLVELVGSKPQAGAFGLLVVAVLATLLTVATLRAVAHPALPAAIAALSVVVILLLVGSIAGYSTTRLSNAGIAGLVLAVCAVSLGVAHAIHLHVLTR